MFFWYHTYALNINDNSSLDLGHAIYGILRYPKEKLMVTRWKPSMERSKKGTQKTEEKGEENKRVQGHLHSLLYQPNGGVMICY